MNLLMIHVFSLFLDGLSVCAALRDEPVSQVIDGLDTLLVNCDALQSHTNKLTKFNSKLTRLKKNAI